ncbi:MAG: chemotaxis protein CheB [Legionellales bacterium]|nr:chemotaxis protein CheB [Legionellales bacterium]
MFEAIVIGVSAGGFEALKFLTPSFPANFKLPIIIVQHVNEQSDMYFIDFLNSIAQLPVKEAEHNESIHSGTIYIAPPGYHLLIEADKTFSLSVDEKVNFSRPSIDLLFESAAYTYGNQLIGIILTGANADGARGLSLVKHYGGCAIVQNPQTAESFYMPQAALEMTIVDYVVSLEQLPELLLQLNQGEKI